MEREKEVALYYPYIDIADTSLIKTSALYWDKLQTIVPHDIQSPYENPATLDAEREGFLKRRDVMWDDRAVKQAGDEFVDDVKNFSEIRDILSRQTDLNLRESSVYDGKISLVCREKLKEYFRENVRERKGKYIMPSILAHSYMSRLASVISHNDGTIPLTDNRFSDSILESRYLSYERQQGQNQGELAKLALQTIEINPAVPLHDIIRFRNNHRTELSVFRRSIRCISRHVEQGLDTAARQFAFQELIRDELIPARQEIETKLAENNLHFVAANIVIMVAGCAGVAISGEWLGQLVNTGILAGAALIGDIRRERLTVKNHPLGYLYQAQKKFGAKN